MTAKVLREAFAYVSVASLSALSDWLVFTGISWLFPHGDVLLAQAPARLTGGLVAFTMHRNWSFRDQGGRGLSTEARRFLGLYVFSFVLSLATVFVLVELLGANRYWSKAFADLLCFVVNFIVMKLYVFADARSIKHAAERLRVAKGVAEGAELQPSRAE
jgi:putative flippase GtrA